MTGNGSSPESPASDPPDHGERIPSSGFLRDARTKLVRQRSFRVRQLSQLDADLALLVSDAARTEIHMALQAGARSALADIELALRRISRGTYGHCPRCGDTMSLRRLTALPKAPMCGRCQRVHDT